MPIAKIKVKPSRYYKIICYVNTKLFGENMYQTKNVTTPTRTNISKILLVAVVGILVLAGCVKIDSTTNISSNNEISGAFYTGIDLSALQGLSNSFGNSGSKSSESDPAVLESQIKQQVEKQKNEGNFPKNVDVAYKKDGKYVGIELIFNNMPLSEYQNFAEKAKKTAKNSNSGSQLGGMDTSNLNIPNITQDGKNFTYTYDTKGLAGNSSSGSMDMSQLMPNLTPVVNLKVTFPGKVESSNGTVDGNTVTWDYGQIKNLNGQPATATGSSSGSSSLLLFAGLGLIVIIIIIIIAGLAIFFVSRKKKNETTPITDANVEATPYGTVAETLNVTESTPTETLNVEANPETPAKNPDE